MHRPKKTVTTVATATKRPEKKKFTYTIVLLQQLPRGVENIFLTGEKNFPRGSGKKLFQEITETIVSITPGCCRVRFSTCPSWILLQHFFSFKNCVKK